MAPSKKTAAAKKTAGKKSTPTAAAASENTERRLVQYTPSSEEQESPKPAAGEKKERKYYEQMRSNMFTIIRTFEDIKDSLKPSHNEYLKKTPFYHLFKSIQDERLTIFHTRKSDAAITAVLEQMDIAARTIKLGSKEVRITPEDVDLIFGIVGGSRKLDITSRPKRNSSFRQRMFPGEKTLQPKLLKEKLQSLLDRRSKKPEALGDAARLLLLIVIGTVFFSTSSATIQWKWLDYVEELDSMQSYNWGEAILKALCDSATQNKDNLQKTQGCTILLMYWLCEHTKLAKKLYNDHLPRVLNWHLPDIMNVTKESLQGLADEEVNARALKHSKTVAEISAYKGHLSYTAIVNAPRASESEDDEQPEELHSGEESDDDEHPGSDSSSEEEEEEEEEEEQKGKCLEGGPYGDKSSDGEDNDSSSGHQDMACIVPEEEGGPSEQQRDEERPAVSAAEADKLLNNLLSENQSLSETVRDLQAKLESTTSQLNELTSANIELKGDNQRLKSELSEQLAKINADTEVPGAGEAGGSSEEEELKLLRTRVKKLEEELIKSNDQNHPVTEDPGAGEAGSSCEEEVQLLRARVKELEDEVTNLKNALADLQLSSVMNDYEKVQLESLEATMKAQETVYRAQIEALQKIVKEREDEILSLQAELCVYEIDGNKDDEEEGSPLRPEAEKIESSSKAKTRSMVRRVKDRKRKPANGDDDDFEYGTPAAKKKAIKKGKKVAASQKPIRTDFNDEHINFLVNVNKKFDQNCEFELEPDVLDKIIQHSNNKNMLTMRYFPKISTAVTVTDVTEIMRCTFISNHVVDAFAESLNRAYNKKLEALILPGHCWTSIVLGTLDHEKLYEKMTKMISCVREGIIMFPMVSPGLRKNKASNHWTLLVCDFVQRKWRFYNSIQPRGSKWKDHYMANASELKEKVETNVDQRLEKAGKSGFPIHEIEAVKPLPQQAPSLNECALYVCYYMEKILKKEAIPDKVRTEEFQEFKAHVIRTILTMKDK